MKPYELAGIALASLLPVAVVVSDRYSRGRNLLSGSGGAGFLGDAMDAPIAGIFATGAALVGGIGLLSGHGPAGLFRGMLIGGGVTAVAAWTWTHVQRVEAEKFLAEHKAADAARLAQFNAQFPGLVQP